MLLLEKNGPICTVTLNRPEVRNAFNSELIRALTKAFQEIEADDAIRVVRLRGAGKTFSAGADLDWMKSMAEASVAHNRRDASELGLLFEVINVCAKPVICEVHGAAMGGGVGLVAVSDIAIAERTTLFSFSEVKLGLIPAIISPYVVSKMGASQARRYFLTAERFSAEDALRFGLVHEVIDGDLEHRSQAIIATLLYNSPEALAGVKRLIRKVQPELSTDVLHYTYSAIAYHRASAQGQEGMSAFLEKRQPNWVK